jgi:hypothetical protein
MKTIKTRFVVLSAGLAAIASLSTAQAGPDPELMDYLIQDVCVDGSDHAIAGDPAACANHRNIMIGEPSPYIVTDFDRNANATYEAMNSIPVVGMDGLVKILYPKNLQGNFDSGFKFSFVPSRDGYDLLDARSVRK